MLRFLGLRLIHTLPVIVGITLAAFVLIHAVPGDPIRIMLGGKASQEHIDEVEHQLGIDRPLPEQYVDFVIGIPRGDLGDSIILRRPVSSVVGERLGPSVFLLAYATLIAVAVALPLGIEAARARGLSESRVVLKHALRNSLIATITVLAVNLGWLISSAVVIEKVFDIPGLGHLLVESIYTRDFPTIQALTLVFGLLVIAINLLSDLAYALVDPRVRYG